MSSNSKHAISIDLLKLEVLALQGNVEDIMTTAREKGQEDRTSKRDLELNDLSDRAHETQNDIDRVRKSIQVLQNDQEVFPHFH